MDVCVHLKDSIKELMRKSRLGRYTQEDDIKYDHEKIKDSKRQKELSRKKRSPCQEITSLKKKIMTITKTI